MKIIKKGMIVAMIAALTGLFMIVSLTSPSDIHPAMLLLFFLLLYIVSVVFINFSILYGKQLLNRLLKKHEQNVVDITSSYMYATVVALAPIILLAINTVGGVSFREVALVIAFEFLAIFYIAKRR